MLAKEHGASLTGAALVAAVFMLAPAQTKGQDAADPNLQQNIPFATDVPFPPRLPDGQTVVTHVSEEFLKPIAPLRDGVIIATTPPTVDFMYYPGLDHRALRWSVWGDGCFADGKYYSAIGDHFGLGWTDDPSDSGNSFIYEYDPQTCVLKRIVDVKQVLDLPEGYYTPGKIHSRVDMGDDGCLYFSTNAGTISAVADGFHYEGDWIFKHDPRTGETEVVAHAPVPGHGLPTSIIDPKRLIFYAGAWIMTERGEDRETGKSTKFLAYDLKNREILYEGPYGPDRHIFFANSTGRAYYVAGRGNFMTGPVWRFDPADGAEPVKLDAILGLRAATVETPQGFVYTVSNGQENPDPSLWAFNTKTETAENLGSVAVGSVTYVATLDVDPTGRYLYYMPGAHGDSMVDGTPVVQYDLKTRQRKVIAFLHPFFMAEYGCAPAGTFSAALDPKGEALYITWNAKRTMVAEWDSCVLTVVHIPESERRP